MDWRLRLASVFFYLAAGWLLLIAVFDLSVSDVASVPWADNVLPVPLAEIHPEVIATAFGLIRFIGSLLLVVGASIVLLVAGPLRRGEGWARWPLIVLSLGAPISMLAAWLRVGMPTPMLAGLGGLIALILVAAYLVTIGARRVA